MSSPPSQARSRRLTFTQKLQYSSGSFLDQAGLHAINQLAYPVFNVIMGLNPALIGYALAVFRLWDSITDPLVGYVTDRCQSRWGRRKPFILVGAILCALLFPVVYFANPGWGQNVLLIWFVGTGILYFSALTLYAIPYQAFGLELVPDYDERNSLFTVRSMVMVVGFMAIGWVYPLAQWDIFSSPLEGTQWLTVLLGLFFFATAIIPVLTLKERFGTIETRAFHGAAKGNLVTALKSAFTNRSYLFLAALQVVLVFGSNLVAALGFYISVFYLYGGDSRAAAPLLGTAGTITSLTVVAVLPLIPVLGRQFSKTQLVAMCLGLQLTGSILKWPCYTPEMPWLSVMPGLLIAIGNIGFWTLVPSMVSDICDIEELATGNRREGIFASITQWMNKLGYTAATALSGVLLVWIGFSSDIKGAQSAETLWWLRFVFTVVPAAAFVIGLLLLAGINLSRERLHQVREELERRRGEI